MKHVGFKTFFGLVFPAAAWFIWTLLWLFGSLLPSYTAWTWPELFDAVTKYLFISIVILIAIGVILFLAHMAHRFFWKAEDTYLPVEE